jgi:demethylmenaquinone methyltransferase/2-methoxy-6-polyprenyl-1,4-benzoquinol methylase
LSIISLAFIIPERASYAVSKRLGHVVRAGNLNKGNYVILRNGNASMQPPSASNPEANAPMSRREYFDKLSPRWDQIIDLSRVRSRLCSGLANMGVGVGEHVLDIGCGTGNLSLCLLETLGAKGRIHAVDISPLMLAKAREKIADPRVAFHEASADNLPLDSQTIDRVICFSTWPHVTDPVATLMELRRVLRDGGWLHIWHIDSRETINHIHQNAGEAVHSDLLPPASELAGLMEGNGFTVRTIVDDDEEYLLAAQRIWR